jgi:hypothetical protein
MHFFRPAEGYYRVEKKTQEKKKPIQEARNEHVQLNRGYINGFTNKAI